MEALFVVLWVVQLSLVNTKETWVRDDVYLSEAECNAANPKIKGFVKRCYKVTLPLSKFKQIKEAIGN